MQNEKLSVVIDGFNLALPQGTGVATYARNLSHALGGLNYEISILYGQPVDARDDQLKEVLFFDSFRAGARSNRFTRLSKKLEVTRAVGKTLFGSPLLARQVVIKDQVDHQALRRFLPGNRRLYNLKNLFGLAHAQFYLTGKFLNIGFKERPDIFHATYPLPVFCPGAKNVCTVHDLVPLKLPFTTLDDKRFYQRLVQRILEQYDLILAVSQKTREDMIDFFGVSEDKVAVTYQAVDIPESYSSEPGDEVESFLHNAYGLEYKNYFLFVGAIEPKKNVGRLIEAYLSANVRTPLVIVGKDGWLVEEETRLLRSTDRLRRGRRIIRIEYVPYSILIRLYRGARAFFFPSLYEGFGLPVLEAMSLGTPVLTSNLSSLPEVAGDAAILVDPYDVRGIAQGIRILANDEAELAVRSEAGMVQAGRFNMAAYQERLDNAYRLSQVRL